MDNVVQFLRARFDDDARAARRVESSWRQVGETGVIVASDGGRAEECANGNWTGIAEHIVRHDPTRVLADIDAKRRILAECAYWYDKVNASATEKYPMPDLGGRFEVAMPILLLLALPYADHPEYRDEWRP